MKIGIFTEGGSHIGFGHVTRCLALAQGRRESQPDGNVRLIVNGDASLEEVLKSESFEWIRTDWRDSGLPNLLKDLDAAVIDSYLADASVYEEIAKHVKTVLYVDDNQRLDYPAGIIFNGSIYAQELAYPRRADRQFLLGTEYTLLRKPFWQTAEKTIRPKVQNVLITFGGDDSKKMTPRVLKLFRESFPEIEKAVVIGKAFQHIDAIQARADAKTRLIFNADVEEMKRLMEEADVAVSAGGQTLYELACIGVPTIAVAVADNQTLNIQGWEKQKFIRYAGWWEETDVLARIRRAFDELRDPQRRQTSSDIGRKAVTGQGARRVADFLAHQFRKELVP